MTIGFPGPHPPYDPTPEMADKYMKRDLPLPDVGDEELDDLAAPWKERDFTTLMSTMIA